MMSCWFSVSNESRSAAARRGRPLLQHVSLLTAGPFEGHASFPRLPLLRWFPCHGLDVDCTLIPIHQPGQLTNAFVRTIRLKKWRFLREELKSDETFEITKRTWFFELQNQTMSDHRRSLKNLCLIQVYNTFESVSWYNNRINFKHKQMTPADTISDIIYHICNVFLAWQYYVASEIFPPHARYYVRV